MKLTNPKDGEVFTSAFKDHKSAVAALNVRLKAGEFADAPFAKSIAKACESGDASAGRLFWLHKLATEGPKHPMRPLLKLDMSGLVTMMDTAKENGLKYPSIVLTTKTGLEVKLSIAGDKSKFTGAVMASAGKFGGNFYGRVMPDGNFYAGKDYLEEVGKLLTAMAHDPKGTAEAQGHLTGRCCFCRKVLDDERSTTLGYGPICAKKFGLLHSRKAANEKKARFGTSRESEPKPKPQQVTRRVIRRIIEEA